MYAQIAIFVLSCLVLLLLSRVGLMWWQWRRVSEAGGSWPVILGGCRVDLHLVAIAAAPGVIAAPWLASSSIAILVNGIWLQGAWLLICLLELSTPLFIIEYDTRPNRLYVDYLKHPQEVFSMIWKGYKGVTLLTLLGLALSSALAYELFFDPPDWGAPSGLFVQLGLLLASSLLLFLAIRGTLRHRPINPSTVAFCSDPLVNTLALNSLYNVAYAIYSMKNERSPADAYGRLAAQDVLATVRTQARLDAAEVNPDIPTLHRHLPRAARRTGTPRNVVLIVEESLGAKYTGYLGGLPLTPELDALSAQAWTFMRAYATGTRSVRGLEALVAGFPPSLSDAVLRLPDAQSRFFTLAQLLKQHGYRSRFIYGGEAHFDNMKSFFLGNGFDELHDRKTFKQAKFVGTWGASDEDMFDRLHELLGQDGDQPTLTLAFSVSNHSPWEYPAGRILPAGEPAAVENTVRYADWALGQFFDRAKRSAYWERTLFLVAADHEARVGGQQLVPVKHFHIPALILGAEVASRRDERIVSQIDLPVTLLSLLGLETEHPMIGHDLADPLSGGRAMMQYGENYGYLKGDQLMVLEPQRTPSQWTLTERDCLEAVALDPVLQGEALAHALWPDMAYRAQQYTLPNLRLAR